MKTYQDSHQQPNIVKKNVKTKTQQNQSSSAKKGLKDYVAKAKIMLVSWSSLLKDWFFESRKGQKISKKHSKRDDEM